MLLLSAACVGRAWAQKRKTTLMLKYYVETLGNPVVLQSIGHNLWIAGVSSVLSTVLGTLLRFCFIATQLSSSHVATLIKLPVLMPPSVVAVFVIGIFSQSRLLARVLFSLGLISTPEKFPLLLYDRGGVGVFPAYLRKQIPFGCYFVMTIMSNITSTLGQMAMCLGATRLKRF